MKRIKISGILITLILTLGFINVNGQEEIRSIKQQLEITLDDLGNADVTLLMKLNASEWDAFKRTMGNNPAKLKREMIKGMPTFYLTDFKYEEEPMDRSYKFSMKAYAAAQQNKQGKWKAELDMKDPDIIKLNDHQFRLNMNMAVNGQLLEQTQILTLPASAKSAKIEKDSFGKAVLTYSMGAGLWDKVLKAGGILFILTGIGMIVFKQ